MLDHCVECLINVTRQKGKILPRDPVTWRSLGINPETLKALFNNKVGSWPPKSAYLSVLLLNVFLILAQPFFIEGVNLLLLSGVYIIVHLIWSIWLKSNSFNI